ncbi:MAG: hypothetical protein LBR85_05705 [Oscillospiraceae bacterium]|jgi:hypothetical protein|nr:hypothetical protein [Oscillospiraceae bacterium]
MQIDPRKRFLLLTALALCAVALTVLTFLTRGYDKGEALDVNAHTPPTQSTAYARELSDAFPQTRESAVPPSPPPAPPEESAPAAENTFIIRTHKGVIAVFEKGGAEPVWTTDTHVARLQPADQIMLQNGVEIAGREAVAHFLEGFSY